MSRRKPPRDRKGRFRKKPKPLPRWRGPDGKFAVHPIKLQGRRLKRGYLDQDQFIEIAEQYGLTEDQAWRSYHQVAR